MPNRKSPRVRAVPAVTRAIAILRLLSRSRTPQGLKAIAESLDLVPSTALHIARALVAEDLLQVDPQTKRYRLGVGMLPLARAVLENADFPSLVRPKLDDISSRYGVMAIGVEVPDLDNMIVLTLAPVRQVDASQHSAGSRGKRSRNDFACCAGTTRRATIPGARKSRRRAGKASASIAAITLPASRSWRSRF